MSKRAHPTTPLWVKLAIVAAVGSALVWWIADRQDRLGNQKRLSAIASEVAGREVRVLCPGPIARLFGYDIREGSVRFGPDGKPFDETNIRKQSCAQLDALAEGRRAAELECTARAGIPCGPHGPETVRAVDVLAHESWHLRGVIDEAVAQCRSMQLMAWTAQQLGATAEQGHALALAQYTGDYKLMPEAYRDGRCVDGGDYDLRPHDDRFP